jgi:sugar phosphate isomerase/epimerase
MRLSIIPALSYAGSYNLSFEDFIVRAKELGFSQVQLTPDQSPNLYDQFDEKRIGRIRDLLSEYQLAVHVHNVFYDINPVGVVPAVRDAAIDITRSVLYFGQGIGAASLTVHPGYMFAGWRNDPVQRERFWASAKLGMESLAQLGTKASIPILLENGSYYVTTATGSARTPLHVGITPDELERLLHNARGGLFLTLDINKALRSGLPITEFLERLGPAIVQCQGSNVTEYREVFIAVFKALAQFRHEVVVVLEGGPDAAVADRDALRLLQTQYFS